MTAFFLKGLTGFGPAMVFVPAVGLLLGPRISLVASAFIDLLVGLGMLLAIRYEKEDWRFILTMSGFMLLGTMVGSSLAGYAPAISFSMIFLCRPDFLRVDSSSPGPVA